jgi:hypothetical protein
VTCLTWKLLYQQLTLDEVRAAAGVKARKQEVPPLESSAGNSVPPLLSKPYSKHDTLYFQQSIARRV